MLLTRKSLYPAAALALALLTAAPMVAMETWDASGSLIADRGGHTATLLNNGRVLVAGGEDIAALASSETFDSATGSWTAVGSLDAARSGHTATLLQNGRVLVAGGDNGGALASSERFSPATGNWITTSGGLSVARFGHTATLLQDGRVLVAGGFDGAALSSCEIFDPGTDTWTATGSLAVARTDHTATLLADGRVLVAGGAAGAALASSEIFDPGTGTWTATGSLGAARSNHTATRLANGRVLAAGGAGATTLASSEIFDPAVGSWSPTATSLGVARFDHTASLLPDGRVLAAGGRDIGALDSSEVFDPKFLTWSATTETLDQARYRHTATILAGGRVLAVGGVNSASSALDDAEIFDSASPLTTASGNLLLARRQHQTSPLADGRILLNGGNRPAVAASEIYDPATGAWAATGSLTEERRFHTSTLLPDGKVLVTGGVDSLTAAVDSAELFDPDAGSWATTGALGTARLDHAGALLGDGRVLVAAGSGDGGNPFVDLASAEIYDPVTGLFSATGSLNTARTDPICTVLTDGKVLVSGGIAGDESTASSELYDPGTGLWTATDSLTTARALSTATLLTDGRVLVTGGVNQTDDFVVLDSVEIYDPATGMWAAGPSLGTPRFDHAATLMADGRVLVSGGFNDSFAPSNSLEIFDPAGAGGSGSFTSAGTLGTARAQHTADLLIDGRVLVAGGSNTINLPEILGLEDKIAFRAHRESIFQTLRNAPLVALGSSELFDRGLGFDPLWRPGITGATDSLGDGEPMVVIGTGFRGVSEASGGNGGQSSPSDYPVVQIRSVETDLVRYLSPRVAVGWTDTSFTSRDIVGFPEGHYRVTVFSNGIPSVSSLGLRDDFPALADLAITKTDGVDEVGSGEPLTYTIVASNSGPTAVTSAQVTDSFNFVLQGCMWTCVGAGGGVCTPGPVAGGISDFVNLPVGATVTYTANCTVNPMFEGNILNTAAIEAPIGITDSLTGNNIASDETLAACAQLDLASQTLNGTQTFRCREITGGDGLEIVSPGNITFDVDERVVLRSGFSVGPGASFRVQGLAGAASASPEEE